MTKTALEYIGNILDNLGINYQLGNWIPDTLPDPYFVGEYNEIESEVLEECGLQDCSFTLTGIGSTLMNLETAKSVIRNGITKTDILSNGNGISIHYLDSQILPIDNGELKRIQINILIKEWKVN